MARYSKFLVLFASMLPVCILGQASSVASADEFYDLLGLQKVVEAIYDSALADLPDPISLDELKAAHKSEFVAALNSRFSLADLHRAAGHMQTHNELPKDVSSWINLELITAFSRAADQLLDNRSNHSDTRKAIELRNTIKRDAPE